MGERMTTLQLEINALQQQLKQASKGARKATIKATLDAKLEELNQIIEALDDDDADDDQPVQEEGDDAEFSSPERVGEQEDTTKLADADDNDSEGDDNILDIDVADMGEE
eukprot:NODE_10407_length_594_cov_63.208068_g10132_i0.p2 GENE.NODE_10407_length_594_cov_63.208068_g10132_i0~~NODE_10407_length_594_cov_63.208068_g10132_i0.p2  ORF type:complete len:110 (+),score=38.68 NODE_10407_length_594_cov_63.208068_g10132_i0:74-403(+)